MCALFIDEQSRRIFSNFNRRRIRNQDTINRKKNDKRQSIGDFCKIINYVNKNAKYLQETY